MRGWVKWWLACAVGHQACRDNRSVLYTRLPRLIDELSLAKGDGRIAVRMTNLARVDLLILDDWGLEPLDGNARHHLLEILEDRYARRSTMVTSQLPVARWHELINDPTYADAILDRLVHNAHLRAIIGIRTARASAPATSPSTKSLSLAHSPATMRSTTSCRSPAVSSGWLQRGMPHFGFDAAKDVWLGVLPRDGEARDIRWFTAPNCFASQVMSAFNDGRRVYFDTLVAKG